VAKRVTSSADWQAIRAISLAKQANTAAAIPRGLAAPCFPPRQKTPFLKIIVFSRVCEIIDEVSLENDKRSNSSAWTTRDRTPKKSFR
jgi:hypothetical protein